MADASEKDLKQENHELLQKLRLAANMELAYQDEIEHLKETLLAAQANQNTPIQSDGHEEELRHLHERLELADEKIRTLSEKLSDSERQRALFQERLNSMELLLEKSESESLLCSTVDSTRSDPVALLEEIAQLKEDLSKADTTAKTTQSKLERQLVELEEDRAFLQSHVAELDRHLKETRNELSNVRAQLEALELQANTTEKTRGSSVFSEVEDRRIRAEKLVSQQRQIIEELSLDKKKLEAECNRKLIDAVRKLEVRFRERDTKFVDELVAERTRLMTENDQLSRRIQQMEELQLDNERNAVKMSKAFNLEGNCQENLINLLERRITALQRSLAERTSLADGLRERLLNASLLRRQMQVELWQQMDTASRLSKRNEELRKQLENRSANAEVQPKADSSKANTQQDTQKANILTEDLSQAVISNGEDKRPKSFTNTSFNEKGSDHLAARNTTSDVEKIEPPPECKIS